MINPPVVADFYGDQLERNRFLNVLSKLVKAKGPSYSKGFESDKGNSAAKQIYMDAVEVLPSLHKCFSNTSMINNEKMFVASENMIGTLAIKLLTSIGKNKAFKQFTDLFQKDSLGSSSVGTKFQHLIKVIRLSFANIKTKVLLLHNFLKKEDLTAKFAGYEADVKAGLQSLKASGVMNSKVLGKFANALISQFQEYAAVALLHSRVFDNVLENANLMTRESFHEAVKSSRAAVRETFRTILDIYQQILK